MHPSILDSKAIDMFQKDLMTLQMIADTYKVSKTSVLKYLKRRGVDTSKHQRELICSNPICGKKILRTKKRARETKRPFCSPSCYFEFLSDPEFQKEREGQRLARRVIEASTTLQDFVPHHIDEDDENNDPKNLLAFKSHGERMRYLRGEEVEVFVLGKMEWRRACTPPR